MGDPLQSHISLSPPVLVSTPPINQSQECPTWWVALMIAAGVFLPTAVAIFFWQKKTCCRCQHSADSKKTDEVVKHQKLTIAPKPNHGCKKMDPSMITISSGQSKSSTSEDSHPRVRGRARSMSSLQLNKNYNSDASNGRGVKKDKKLKETVNWLLRTLQGTNMSLLNLMQAVVQVTNDIQVLRNDNVYICRRLQLIESLQVARQRQ